MLPRDHTSFSIIKVGYPSQNETLDYNAQPLPPLDIALTGGTSSGNNSGNTLIIVVALVVTAAVVVVVVGLFVVKRRQSPSVKKLQALKKQMKPQFDT